MKIFLALLICIIATPAFAGQTTVRYMLDHARFWPGDNGTCRTTPCVLTGPGGIVSVWERYVDNNLERGFVVKGRCASACEIAYRRALAKGADVRVMPGATLVKHTPSPAVWR